MKPPGLVVSVHFPKAGGTSLKRVLAVLFGERLHADYEHDPLIAGQAVATRLPAGVRAVHGHFWAGRYDGLNPAFRCTFLRDPVDVMISTYFYWRQHDPGADHETGRRFKAEQPTVFQMAAYPKLQRLMSETYFGGYDMGRFDFIGDHASYEADAARLVQMLGLPPAPVPHENRTAPDALRQEMQQDPALRAKLRNILREDVAFYEGLRERRPTAALA